MIDNESAGRTERANRRVVRYTGGESEPPSIALVTAVARFRGIDPIELDESLHRYVDLDALDALFEARPTGEDRDPGTVRFDVDDLSVVLEGNEVVVRERPGVISFGSTSGSTGDR